MLDHHPFSLNTYHTFKYEPCERRSDIRHNFTFDAGYDVPSFRKVLGDGLPRWIADGWQLKTLTQIRSGFPVNVTVTGGIFGGALRPNLVQGVPTRPSNYSVPNNQFNISAFHFQHRGLSEISDVMRCAVRDSRKLIFRFSKTQD